MPIQATCDATEIARIEAELAKNQSPINVGVGVIDLRTGQVRLFTYDETNTFSRVNHQLQVMAGHEAAATMAGIPLDEARGFVLGKAGADWHLFNQSHLNRIDGQTNTMQMTPVTFDEILAALRAAGVNNLIVP